MTIRWKLGWVTYSALAAIVLLIAYGGTYAALARPRRLADPYHPPIELPVYSDVSPMSSNWNLYLAQFFAPAHEIDKRLRPGYWSQ